VLLLLNVASLLEERSFSVHSAATLAVVQLVGDAAVSVLVVDRLGTRPASVAWVALALPVVEGAVRAQLRGCLLGWGAVAAGYGALAAARGAPTATTLIPQLTALLFLGLPAAYLSQCLRGANAQLEHAATHDALTGLPNRLLLTRVLERVTPRLRRGEGVAVLFLDLDGFKRVNDTLGHRAGDELLVHVGQRIVAAVPDAHVAARLAGDEFVVAVGPHVDAPHVERLVARLRDAIEEPVEVGGHLTRVGASIGVATTSDRGTAVSTLLAGADREMYRAKGSRRAKRAGACAPALSPSSVPDQRWTGSL
jgi:diguanylate cyclase (GGDEF)-like protein